MREVWQEEDTITMLVALGEADKIRDQAPISEEGEGPPETLILIVSNNFAGILIMQNQVKIRHLVWKR